MGVFWPNGQFLHPVAILPSEIHALDKVTEDLQLVFPCNHSIWQKYSTLVPV